MELISVAELRARLARVLSKIDTSDRPLYVTQRGQVRAVLLPVRQFEALEEYIEDLYDTVEVLKAKAERLKGGADRGRQRSAARGRTKRGRIPA